MKSFKEVKLYFSERKDFYMYVRIYESRKEMQQCAYKLTGMDNDKKSHALCYQYRIEPIAGEFTPELATVFFYRDGMSAGITAHEFLHASLWYMLVDNGNQDQKTSKIENLEQEEQVACALTYSIEHFERWLVKQKR